MDLTKDNLSGHLFFVEQIAAKYTVKGDSSIIFKLDGV